MIVTTLSSYPNKKVVKDLGLVFGYDNAYRPVRMVMDLDTYFEKAIAVISKKAEAMGANAVLGVCFDLRDAAKPILLGTAVILEDIE